MSRDKFNIDDLIKKGYSLVGDTLVPPATPTPKQKKIIKDVLTSTESGFMIKEHLPEKITDGLNVIKTEWKITGNVVAKKNSRQNFVKNGRQISIPSKKYAEYEKMTAMQYQVFGIEFRRAVKHFNIQYPLRVEFTFIRGSKHRADFTNLCQCCEDIMVENSWIPDDDGLHLIPSFQPFEYDKKNPLVKIKLLVK